MRHELTDYEWAAIKSMLPNKPRGVPLTDASAMASSGSCDLGCHGPHQASVPAVRAGHCHLQAHESGWSTRRVNVLSICLWFLAMHRPC